MRLIVYSNLAPDNQSKQTHGREAIEEDVDGVQREPREFRDDSDHWLAAHASARRGGERVREGGSLRAEQREEHAVTAAVQRRGCRRVRVELKRECVAPGRCHGVGAAVEQSRQRVEQVLLEIALRQALHERHRCQWVESQRGLEERAEQREQVTCAFQTCYSIILSSLSCVRSRAFTYISYVLKL